MKYPGKTLFMPDLADFHPGPHPLCYFAPWLRVPNNGANCRNFIEREGGRIRVESEEGNGTRFRLHVELRSGHQRLGE